jgi:hypothetical protein
VAQRLQLQALPYTVILDREGRVAMTTTGTGDEAVDRVSRTARRLVTEQPYATSAGQNGNRVEAAAPTDGGNR